MVFNGFLFIILLAVFGALAVWFADNPGSVVIDWQGRHFETSFAVLLAAVAGLMAGSALLYRLYRVLVEAPGRLRRHLRDQRCHKGYLALTRGLVAVAAGDAQGVRQQAWRVEKYLDDPPLTLLLSAQAAQLAGDEKQATRFFQQMRDNPETEFFGLRGLITQAMKRGDWETARKLAGRAHGLNPRSEWVAGTLLRLEARAGNWDAAGRVLEDAAKQGLVARDRLGRRRALVDYEKGVAAHDAGDKGPAVKHLRKALDADPGFVPASVRLARVLVDQGKVRKAQSEVEAAWKRTPHPELFEVYCEARRTTSALERLKAAQRLASMAPEAAESQVTAARAALEARLWGEARKHLDKALEAGPTARVYGLLAEVEESEHGDLPKAHEWLVRAALADPDPAWVCADCAAVVPEWSALCPSCGALDALDWRTPPHVARIDAEEAPDGSPRPALPPAAAPTVTTAE